jgi:hypothetical protein
VKWCCTVKSCNAKIYVDESRKVLLKSDGVHNHEVCKNLKRNIITNSLKRKATEDLSERPVKLIHKEIIATPTPSEKLNSLDIYSIKIMPEDKLYPSYQKVCTTPMKLLMQLPSRRVCVSQ